MEYYQIPLQQLPRFSFAHTYRTSDEIWYTSRTPGLFEISYNMKGPIIVSGNGWEFPIAPGEVLCLDHAERCQIRNPGRDHMHVTAAFFVDGIRRTAEREPGFFAYLPVLPLRQENKDIYKTLEQLAAFQRISPVQTAALILSLLSALDELSAQPEGGENILCYRVRRLVEKRVNENIRPSELAENLGVSYAHLSRVFRKETGMTLTEYINRQKLERVREFLLISDMTLERAGQNVGFDDPKYLSRLFHKTYGITAREYLLSARSRENPV